MSQMKQATDEEFDPKEHAERLIKMGAAMVKMGNQQLQELGVYTRPRLAPGQALAVIPKAPQETVICVTPGCGVSFVPTNKNHEVCTRECYIRAQSQCVEDGKRFITVGEYLRQRNIEMNRRAIAILTTKGRSVSEVLGMKIIRPSSATHYLLFEEALVKQIVEQWQEKKEA